MWFQVMEKGVTMRKVEDTFEKRSELGQGRHVETRKKLAGIAGKTGESEKKGF